MTRKLLWIALAVCVAGGAWWMTRPTVHEKVPVRLKHTIATDEDPEARARFEWMRLHDPATGQVPAGIRRRELDYARTLPTREFLSMGKTGGQPFQWEARGPANLGGRTRALAIDVSNENTLLAGGVSGGMWRSTDSGMTWTLTSDPNQHPSVTALAQDTRPGKTNTWYYGAGELLGNSASAGQFAFYTGRGVHKSTDGGRSWTLTRLSDTTPQFNSVVEVIFNVAVDASNLLQDEVYAAVYGAIYRSADGGESWTPTLSSGSGALSPYTDVAVTPTGVVYAAFSSESANGGLWRSPDGVTWTRITPPGWPAVFGRTVIGLAPSNPNVVYFLAVTPGAGGAGASLWKYTYGSGTGAGAGGVWENRTANIPTDADFPDRFSQLDVGGFDPQGGYNLLVRVKPDNENVVFLGGTNLYRSTDGFASEQNTAWIAGYHPVSFLYPDHHPDQHALVFYPSNPNSAITGSDGGVHRTANILATFSADTPVRWTSLNNGYMTTQFYSVAIDHATAGDAVIIGGMQDNGTFFTNAKSGKEPWVGDLLGGDGAFTDIADGREFYYVSAQEAQIYRLRLTAGGMIQGFARVDPPEDQFGPALFVTPFILDPADQNRMYLGGGSRVWRNNNLSSIPDGNTQSTLQAWQVLTNTGGTGMTITALGPAAVPSPGGMASRLYYGAFRSAGNNVFESKVFRLDNAHTGNPVPVDITSAAFPQGGYVSCLAVHPADPNQVVVVFSNYSVRSLFYTADGGASWTHIGGNLEERPDGSGSGPSVRWVQILPREDATVFFAGTSTGLYSTTRLAGDATVWVQEGAGTIGNVVVDMVDARMVDGRTVAGTHGRGVFSTTVPARVGVGIEPEPGELPATVSISAVYPNPFGRTAQLTVAVAHPQPVHVDVYDETGRRITRLFEGYLAPGERRLLSLDAAGLARGVYFFHIRGETFAETRRAVHLY